MSLNYTNLKPIEKKKKREYVNKSLNKKLLKY